MNLLTKEIIKQLPKLGAQYDKGLDAIVYAKFFTRWCNWTWYASEFDGEDIFFGLVDGLYKELGYFSLSELQSIEGIFGLHLERDLYFLPTKLKDLI